MRDGYTLILKNVSHSSHPREPEKFSLEEPLVPKALVKSNSICFVKLRKGVSRWNFLGYMTVYISVLLILIGSSLLFSLLV